MWLFQIDSRTQQRTTEPKSEHRAEEALFPETQFRKKEIEVGKCAQFGVPLGCFQGLNHQRRLEEYWSGGTTLPVVQAVAEQKNRAGKGLEQFEENPANSAIEVEGGEDQELGEQMRRQESLYQEALHCLQCVGWKDQDWKDSDFPSGVFSNG